MRTLLASLVLLSFATDASAQAAKTPEQLLSAESLVYFRYDGYEPHKKAYDRTALSKAMKEGLSEFFDHAFSQLAGLAGDLSQHNLKKGPRPATNADAFLDCISTNGFVLGLEVAPARFAVQGAEDLFHLTLVFPNGAEKKNRQAIDAFFQSAARTFDIAVEEAAIGRRSVQAVSFGQVKAAWWPEGKHLVCAIGVNAVQRSLKVIDGDRPNLTAAPWHRDFAAFNRYETDMRGYVNLETIVDRAAAIGLDEPGLDNLKERFTRHLLLRHLGLTGLKDLTFHLGFDGKFQRSTVHVGVVEPEKRAGLLRLVSGPIAYGLDKLPPLPPDADYVSVRHVDWVEVMDYIRTSYGMLAVSNLIKNGEFPARFPDLDRMVGGDFRKDFLEQLDTTVVCYGGHSEGPFFLGQGFAIKVKDAAKVRKGLDALTKELGRSLEPLTGNKNFTPEKRKFRGQEMIVYNRLLPPVTYTIHDGWLVFGLFPQPVQGFLLRSGGKYKTWKIPPEAEEALAKERKDSGKAKLLGVSVSDPRPAIQLGLSLLPVFAQSMNLSAGMTILDVSKIPNAQSVNEWVFPNTAFFYDDGNALRWEHHYSINEPDDFLLLLMSPAAGLLPLPINRYEPAWPPRQPVMPAPPAKAPERIAAPSARSMPKPCVSSTTAP